MISVNSAGFCDHQVPVLSTIGKGPKGDKGDFAPEEQITEVIESFLLNHPELTTTVIDGSVSFDKLNNLVRAGYVRVFDTVADMQAATDLIAGNVCHTNGFHTLGDGGAAYYTISTSGTANGMDVLALQSELYATLVVTEPYVTPEQLGAYGDGTTDDHDSIQAAINIAYQHGAKVVLGKNTYRIASRILVDKPMNIEGFSSRDTIIKCDGCDGFAMSGENNVILTGIYIRHVKLTQTTLSVGTWPTFSGQSCKGLYLQCLNSIIEDVVCIGFEYGIWLYAAITDHGVYQPLVNGGENHIINLCETIFCSHGIVIDTWDTFASNLKTGYCLNGIEMAAGKLMGAHVWGWYNTGYRFKGAAYKPANVSDLELETCLANINPNQTETPIPCDVQNSVTICGFTYWSIGTTQPLFYVRADNVRLNVTGLSIGNYGTIDSSLTDSTVQPIILRIDSNQANVFCYFEGSTLSDYESGQLFINNSPTSRAVSSVFTTNGSATTWHVLQLSATVDKVRLVSM